MVRTEAPAMAKAASWVINIKTHQTERRMTMNTVNTSIRQHTSGIISSSPYQAALDAATLQGGEHMSDYLNCTYYLNRFLKTIASYGDDDWNLVTNETTGIPLYYLVASIGGIECRLELTYDSEDYSELGKDDKPTIQKMITTTINVGDSTLHKTTHLTTTVAEDLSLIPIVMDVWLRGVKRGIQKGLNKLAEAQFDNYPSAIEAETLTDADIAVKQGVNDALEEAIQAEKVALKDVAFEIGIADGCMIALVVIAVGAMIFSKLAHTTHYSLSIENKTGYTIRWSKPNMSHGTMNSAPMGLKDDFEYRIPKLHNSSPKGYTPKISYTNAPFTYVEEKALYGVTGSMKLEFLDDEDIIVQTATIAFNIPYSGTNGLGIAFDNDSPSHENPHKNKAWGVISPDNKIALNASISALSGEQTLPGQKKGYTYASTVAASEASGLQPARE